MGNGVGEFFAVFEAASLKSVAAIMGFKDPEFEEDTANNAAYKELLQHLGEDKVPPLSGNDKAKLASLKKVIGILREQTDHAQVAFRQALQFSLPLTRDSVARDQCAWSAPVASAVR